ncbi:hypothetical protein B9Z55_017052 [Caenorhabditis nigoni]|uniref:Uncharacterized protein n=1 Tax=Caenorhabditis nigoni TaxID=1611254 RepID=A0A2G5T7V2_9PELO|nr:hypothetical protein B9Z55_017052 [Caenorhabditis nigoni]
MRLFILLSCLLAWVLAAPYIDQEDALHVLNAYLEQFGPAAEKVYYVAEDDHGLVLVKSRAIEGFAEGIWHFGGFIGL